jgi:hypothetical protein
METAVEKDRKNLICEVIYLRTASVVYKMAFL